MYEHKDTIHKTSACENTDGDSCQVERVIMQQNKINNILQIAKSSKENARLLKDTLNLSDDYVIGWESALQKIIDFINDMSA